MALTAAYPVEIGKRRLGTAELALSYYSLGLGDEEQDYERDEGGTATEVELTAQDLFASLGFATSFAGANVGATGWVVSSRLTSEYSAVAFGGNAGVQYSWNFLYFGKPAGTVGKPAAAVGKPVETAAKPSAPAPAAAPAVAPPVTNKAPVAKAPAAKTGGKKTTKKAAPARKTKKKESTIAKIRKLLRDVDTPNMAVGLSAVNLGTAPAYDQESSPPPMLVQGGISYQPIREFRLLADGGYALTEKSAIVAVGIEYVIADTVAVRGGVRYDRDELGVSGGLGYRGTFGALRGKLDYGIAPRPGDMGGVTHSASIHVEF
jgi:hypothetical protein